MLPIVPPVNAQSPKDAIANLHEALLFLKQQVKPAEIKNKEYSDSTRKIVMTFQRQFGTTETDGFVGRETAAQLNKILKDNGAFPDPPRPTPTPPPATDQYKLSGKAINVTGVPLTNARVVIYSTGLEADKVLGETSTDENGNYSFAYPADLSRNVRQDLQARVVEEGTAVRELGRSNVKYNAGADEILDVIIPAATEDKPNEHQRLLNDLKPHLGRLAMQDIKETQDRGQISHLANKAAWDARMVAMAVEAEKWSAETQIPAAHLYALFRAGLPNDRESFSRISPDAVEGVLKKAIDEKLIVDDGRIGETAKAFDNFGVNFLLDRSAAGGVSSLGSMLGIRLNDDQKRIFVQTSKQSGSNAEKFWSVLRDRGFDDSTVRALQLDGKLGYLTIQNAPLVRKIYDTHRIGDASDLVRNGFYKQDKWESILDNDVPQGIDRKDYAKHMTSLVNISYPTAVVAEMMNNDEVALGPNVPKQEVYRFLNSNQQKFTIGEQPVKKWDGFNALSNESKVSVKILERLYQLTPSNESMQALSKTGLTSAYQISRYTKDEFMMKYSQSFSNYKGGGVNV